MTTYDIAFPAAVTIANAFTTIVINTELQQDSGTDFLNYDVTLTAS